MARQCPAVPEPTILILATAGTFLLAGFVKGVIGIGLPSISIGLLSLLLTPTEAAATLVLPSFVINIVQLAGPLLAPLARRLAWLLVATCVGVWIGAATLSGVSPKTATTALGIMTAIYALYGLGTMPVAVPPRAEPYLSPVVGFLTGLGASITGVFMIPGVPFLQALGLGRDGLIQALGLFFTISTLALAAALAKTGMFTSATIIPTLTALAASLLGLPLGTWLRRRIEPETFRKIFFVGLLVLGLYLTWRGLR
jgi:uncharacterized membrane protein YfcA